jgi:hypothetical protein
MAVETLRQVKIHLILAQQFRSGFEIVKKAFHARLLERIKKSIQIGFATRELSAISRFSTSAALKESHIQSRKLFYATYQDIEESRVDFVKGNLLNYANAVSKTYMANAAVRFLSPCIRQYSQHRRNAVL